MKHLDPEPIQTKFYALNKDSNRAKETFKRAEKWREILLIERNEGIDKYNKMIGFKNENISILLNELELINAENKKTQLKRKLFKIIHKDLSTV